MGVTAHMDPCFTLISGCLIVSGLNSNVWYIVWVDLRALVLSSLRKFSNPSRFTRNKYPLEDESITRDRKLCGSSRWDTSHSYRSNVVWWAVPWLGRVLFPWRWGGSSTQAWMPTYVSILRIPQLIWVWRATVEWYWQGKTEELGEKPVPVPLCPPQNPHGLTRASHGRIPGSRPGQSMDLWWTEWRWDRFFRLSFHRRSPYSYII
jgi:hypothetical protein